MSDDSVTDNMITFLVAGHETTSGLLSFVFYYLLRNPAAYQKAQQEVDNVIGKARFIAWPPSRWGGVRSVNPQQNH